MRALKDQKEGVSGDALHHPKNQVPWCDSYGVMRAVDFDPGLRCIYLDEYGDLNNIMFLGDHLTGWLNLIDEQP